MFFGVLWHARAQQLYLKSNEFNEISKNFSAISWSSFSCYFCLPAPKFFGKLCGEENLCEFSVSNLIIVENRREIFLSKNLPICLVLVHENLPIFSHFFFCLLFEINEFWPQFFFFSCGARPSDDDMIFFVLMTKYNGERATTKHTQKKQDSRGAKKVVNFSMVLGVLLAVKAKIITNSNLI